MKMAESYSNMWKTLWEKEKLLIMSNFSYFHSVFKRLVSQGRQEVLLCGNGLIRPAGYYNLPFFFPFQFIDLRLTVLGNVDSGKSTLLGVLTHGELDNGRGRARLNLFRHLHEIQTGRTSCISHEILGFNDAGEVSYAHVTMFHHKTTLVSNVI